MLAALLCTLHTTHAGVECLGLLDLGEGPNTPGGGGEEAPSEGSGRWVIQAQLPSKQPPRRPPTPHTNPASPSTTPTPHPRRRI